MVFFSEQGFFILLKFPFCKLVAAKFTGEKYFIWVIVVFLLNLEEYNGFVGDNVDLPIFTF